MLSSGGTPRGMETASLSLAGCDCRPMGTSPIETKIAPRVFGYRISKRRQELTELDSRDARASGSRRARRCHVCLSSDRTARAVPLGKEKENKDMHGIGSSFCRDASKENRGPVVRQNAGKAGRIALARSAHAMKAFRDLSKRNACPCFSLFLITLAVLWPRGRLEMD